MTRVEAIERLKSIKSLVDKYDDVVALREAIKALEQKPWEDWYDVPSDEMTLEQARQAVKDLRKKLVEHLDQESCEDSIRGMTKEQKDKILKALAEDRNDYARECERRIEKEQGKITGADYMCQRFLDILRAEDEYEPKL